MRAKTRMDAGEGGPANYCWGDGINNHNHDYKREVKQNFYHYLQQTKCKSWLAKEDPSTFQESIAVGADDQHNHIVSLAKRQSEELYSFSKQVNYTTGILSMSSNAQEYTHGEMRKLTGFPQGTEQLGVAATRLDVNSSVDRKQNIRCPNGNPCDGNYARPYNSTWVTTTMRHVGSDSSKKRI